MSKKCNKEFALFEKNIKRGKLSALRIVSFEIGKGLEREITPWTTTKQLVLGQNVQVPQLFSPIITLKN